MSRLLLLMTTRSYRAAAFLTAAERLGVEVTIGSDRPQLLAEANPAGSLLLDFRDLEAARHEILAFCMRHSVGAVLAADDDGAILAARACASLGLRHSPAEAVAAARNKHAARVLMAQAGLLSPRFERFWLDGDPREVASKVGYPCVVKPLSLSGSRGVMRADDSQQLIAAFDRLAAILEPPDPLLADGDLRRHALVESFIPGDEVALEGLLVDGSLRALALFDKPDPLVGPFFEESIYVTPSRHPEPTQSAAIACAALATAALGLTQGPVHVEMRLNERGAWILEVAPRSIGGLCSRTLRFAGGASLEDLILRHALGWDLGSCVREEPAAGVMMIPIPKAGILREVGGQREALDVDGIEDLVLTVPLGARVLPPPEGSRYLGFLFARSSSPARVERSLREAHARLTLVIEPDLTMGAGQAERSEPSC